MNPLPTRAAGEILAELAEPKNRGLVLWVSYFEIYGGKAGADTRPPFSPMKALSAGYVGLLNGFSDQRRLPVSRHVDECKPLREGVRSAKRAPQAGDARGCAGADGCGGPAGRDDHTSVHRCSPRHSPHGAPVLTPSSTT